MQNPSLVEQVGEMININGRGNIKHCANFATMDRILCVALKSRRRGSEGEAHRRAKETLIQAMPAIIVRCNLCKSDYIIDLSDFKGGKLHAERTLDTFRMDLAVVVDNELVCVVEVLATSKISEKKRKALERLGIPWCEVMAGDVNVGGKLWAKRGSNCDKCRLVCTSEECTNVSLEDELARSQKRVIALTKENASLQEQNKCVKRLKTTLESLLQGLPP
jgi:hypothetical protein